MEGDKPNQRNVSARKTKTPVFWTGVSCCLIGQLPTLPHTRACSTIGAEGLNFRVRDGNGWDPFARVTQNWFDSRNPEGSLKLNIDGTCHKNCSTLNALALRTAPTHQLLCIHS